MSHATQRSARQRRFDLPQRDRGTNAWKTMDPDGARNEFVHAVVLALDNFRVENHGAGPTNRERCEPTNWGRGCL
jgi:hypothetical protein